VNDLPFPATFTRHPSNGTIKLMNEQFDQPTPTAMRRANETKRERFLAWCTETGEDPEDEGSWDSFNDIDSFWEDMDDDIQADWTDNMNKE
jgi:hypothetical protein